jgi:hypothetical protein
VAVKDLGRGLVNKSVLVYINLIFYQKLNLSTSILITLLCLLEMSGWERYVSYGLCVKILQYWKSVCTERVLCQDNHKVTCFICMFCYEMGACVK